MPLITRIGGVRVEFHREVKSFIDKENLFVTWKDEANSELFGLGLVDRTTREDDVQAISALMIWALEEKYPMTPTLSINSKLVHIEAHLLSYYGKDWRKVGREIPYDYS